MNLLAVAGITIYITYLIGCGCIAFILLREAVLAAIMVRRVYKAQGYTPVNPLHSLRLWWFLYFESGNEFYIGHGSQGEEIRVNWPGHVEAAPNNVAPFAPTDAVNRQRSCKPPIKRLKAL